jgi:hypothetical protein
VFNETGGGKVVVGRDGYGFRSDGGTLLGNGNIQIDNGKAYSVVVQSSGLTPEESATLAKLDVIEPLAELIPAML